MADRLHLRTNTVAPGPPGRIGPNAIIRVMEAVDTLVDPSTTRALMDAAGLAGYRHAPPTGMVAEHEVATLHGALVGCLGPRRAREISRHAGVLTARYLLARRIPGWTQPLLRRLPAPMAGRILLKAVARNAWTFAGSARFSYTTNTPWEVTLRGCPLCAHLHATAPTCDYYAMTFQHLFQDLVAPHATVTEVTCQATGAEACVFRITI